MSISTNKPKITPYLWFDKEAEEAMNLYCSIFKNSKVISVSKFSEEAGATVVEFELEGQRFTAFNAGPQFKFTEAISFYVDCENQEEVDYYWDKFISSGGEESQCGWLKDKFGVSWQIVPRRLIELMTDKDPVKAKRVVDAMMEMQKIDVEALEKAYEN